MKYKISNWYLYFSVITANLYYVTIGMNFSWNSPVLPKFSSNDTDINPLGKPVTLIQISILTTLLPLGAIIGTLLIGKLPDLIGRKRTIRYLSMLTISSYMALFFGTHIYVFYVFLTVVSVSAAAANVVVPMYTTEIAEDHNRGKLGSLLSVGVSLGQFFTYLIGPLVNVNLFALICALPVLLVLILSNFIPESPVYLAAQGEKTEAIMVLKRLRRQLPLSQIEDEYSERQHILLNKNSIQETSFKEIFNSKSGKRAFFISIGIIILHEASGMYIVISFLAPFLNEAGTEMSGENLAVIIAAGKILIAIVSLNLIEKLGRRFLILFGSSICGISMLLFGLYLYFKNNSFIMPPETEFIPIFCIVTFIIAYSFGLSSVSFIVISELLPNEFRSVGSCIVQLIGGIFSIGISFAFPLAAKYVGKHYCMFTFSLFCFTGFIFTFLKLPETRGRSFSEIRSLLND